MKQTKKLFFLTVTLSFGAPLACREKVNPNLAEFREFYDCYKQRAFIPHSNVTPPEYVRCRSRHIELLKDRDLDTVSWNERDYAWRLRDYVGLKAADDQGNQALRIGNVDLRGLKLRKARLAKSTLEGTRLQGSDLSGANFEDATLKSTNLDNTNLSNANFAGSQLDDVNFDGANLSGMTGLEDPKTKVSLSTSFENALNMPFAQRCAAKARGLSIPQWSFWENFKRCPNPHLLKNAIIQHKPKSVKEMCEEDWQKSDTKAIMESLQNRLKP